MIADLCEYGRAPTPPIHAPPANDVPAKAEPPRSWIVVCKALGMVNLIAESAEELVERLHLLRESSAACATPQLIAFDVVDNTDEGLQAVLWFDPALVQAVLNEYKPPVPKRGFPMVEEPAVPADAVAPEVGLVVVESEPDDRG